MLFIKYLYRNVRVPGKAGCKPCTCPEDQLSWRETNLRKTNEEGIAIVNSRTYKSMN